MKKIDYDYKTYKTWVENSLKLKNLDSIVDNYNILDFSSYSKSIVC